MKRPPIIAEVPDYTAFYFAEFLFMKKVAVLGDGRF